jgi:hypothetical protein
LFIILQDTFAFENPSVVIHEDKIAWETDLEDKFKSYPKNSAEWNQSWLNVSDGNSIFVAAFSLNLN